MSKTAMWCAIAAASLAWNAFAAPAKDAATVYDVPLLPNIIVDADSADWGDDGFCVEAMAYHGKLDPAADFFPRFRLGWNERGLLILVLVRDDVATEAEKVEELWRRDSVEVFVAEAVGSPNAYQMFLAPGADPKQKGVGRGHFVDRRPEGDNDRRLAAEFLSKTVEGLTVTEIMLPWANLGIEPGAGTEIGFQLYVNDHDGRDKKQATWFPKAGAHTDTKRMYCLRLAEQPSPPVLVSAAARYEHLIRTRVEVVAASELKDKPVRVLDGESALGEAALVADGERCVASLALPMPRRGKPYGPLRVEVGGTEIATIRLPNPDGARRREFEDAELSVARVFVGRQLPDVAFAQPGWIETLVGECAFEVAYYDANHNTVETAGEPGRYGAVVRITPEYGDPVTRFVTLFRQPTGFRWDQWKWKSPLPELPPGLGIKPAVLTRQRETFAEYLRWRLAASASEDADTAVLLAGLYETAASDPPAVNRTNVWERDRRWWFGLKQKLGLVDTRHLLYLPPDYDRDKAKRWPLLLFLHGAGERGSDLERVKVHGPPKLIKQGRDFPFIVVSPQCPKGEWWLPVELAALLDEIEASHRVDPDRLYCTGLSMGGYGTWALATEFPNRFAAIAPICGGGDPRDAARIKHLPIWVFHGAKDGVVPVQRSHDMVDALRKLGAKPMFTVYPEAGHDSWTATYEGRRLYDWLLTNRRAR